MVIYIDDAHREYKSALYTNQGDGSDEHKLVQWVINNQHSCNAKENNQEEELTYNDQH